MYDGLDEPGSYERFYLSSLFWLHARLRRNATSAVVKAMQITTPATSSYGPRLGHADPAFIIGFARSDEAAACRARAATHAAASEEEQQLQEERCYADALVAHPLAEGQRRSHFRLQDCRPPEGMGRSPAYGGGSAAAAPGFRWRQRVEAQGAHDAGVPLFRRAAARRSRWDLHPGIKWAQYSLTTAIFDCLHSVRAPGAFDAEVHELERALHRRFSKGRA